MHITDMNRHETDTSRFFKYNYLYICNFKLCIKWYFNIYTWFYQQGDQGSH